MTEHVPVEDRLAIEDVLGRYLWAVDIGNVDAVVAQFTSDATVRYGDGRRFEGPDEIRAFAVHAIGGPEARGRMHFNKPLFAQWQGSDILLRSYLLVPQWHANTGTGANTDEKGITLGTQRYVEDTFRRTKDGWLIRERAIFLWNGLEALWDKVRAME